MKIWPFTSPEPSREVTLDDHSLDRAIRAGVQFPLDWFLEQTPEIQEAIANRRDYWLEDLVVAAGYAILDPERTSLALAAEDGDDEAEEKLTGLNAQAVAEAMGRHAAREHVSEPQRPSSLSMGGMGERQREAADKVEADRRKSEFFGAEEVTA
tara:strand:- start:5169 stop:5630 length:462 start_codon:yes stop_codon:yes gene_type:complete